MSNEYKLYCQLHKLFMSTVELRALNIDVADPLVADIVDEIDLNYISFALGQLEEKIIALPLIA